MSSDVVLLLSLHVSEPLNYRFSVPLRDVVYIQSLPGVFNSHMLSLLVAAAHRHIIFSVTSSCLTRELVVGTVSVPWLNNRLMNLSLDMWWYPLGA